jgi:hypothetical protein
MRYMREPRFKKGDVVCYPNKGYDYRIAEYVGNDDTDEPIYEIVFDKPKSLSGQRFRTQQREEALVLKKPSKV